MLKLQGLRKIFSQSFHPNSGSEVASVDHVNLEILEGEFFSLVGPSGCGKTTLLRMISGLEKPTSGQIILNGQDITFTNAQNRPFNMVFQKYALFPHMTVSENIAFGLKLKKMDSHTIQSRVQDILALVEMLPLKDRFPDTLSGGQAQRVAIARALVNEPKVLLLDEPLSALDQKLREHMQIELKSLQKRLGLTFVYVTHDQEEALALSDRIAVMNKGRIEQVSSPSELYENPQSLFAAQFIGSTSRFEGRLSKIEGDFAEIGCGSSVLRGRLNGRSGLYLQSSALAVVRPEKVSIHSLESSICKSKNTLKGQVIQSIFRGTEYEVLLELENNQNLRAFTSTSQKEFKPNDLVQASFSVEDVHIFCGDSLS